MIDRIKCESKIFEHDQCRGDSRDREVLREMEVILRGKKKDKRRKRDDNGERGDNMIMMVRSFFFLSYEILIS